MHHGPELSVVVIAGIVLIAGAATRVISRRTRFPYTIAMLVVGFAVGLGLRLVSAAEPVALVAMLQQGASLSPHLIIFVFLPALVFESAFGLQSYAFRKNIWQIAMLAGPALVACTVATAVVLRGLTAPGLFGWNWDWMTALVFGALISATDPVAVVALLREVGAPRRLSVMIEGESLLNDGTSIVVFTVFLSVLTGAAAALNPGAIAFDFVRVVAGGILVGLVLAVAVSRWLAGTFNDALVEITLTLVLAYAAMVVAEAFLHVSGVMAVVTAGLWMSARGKTRISPEVEHFLHQFWEMLAYIANTLIFYLVGLVIATQVQEARLSDLLLIGAVWAAVMLIRAGAVFAFRPILNLQGDPVQTNQAVVIGWGGLRGAVSLALALVVSQHPAIDPLVGRQILLLTAGVVLLTILVNGSTMAALLRAFRLDQAPLPERLARLTADAAVLREVGEKISAVRRSKELRTVLWNEVEQDLGVRKEIVDGERQSVQESLSRATEAEKAGGDWRQALEIERQTYWAAYASGTLGASAVQILDHEIEEQLDRIAHGDLEPPSTRTLERRSLLDGWLGRLRRSEHGILTPMQFGRLSLLYDLSRAEAQAAEAVLGAIEQIEGMNEGERLRIHATYEQYRLAGRERLEDLRANLPEVTQAIETRLARRISLNFEREGYDRLSRRGILDHDAAASALQQVRERMKKLWFESTRVALPDFRELCRATPLFTQLDAAALDRVAELAREQVLAPGDYLFRENDHGDSMYFVVRGALQVLKRVGGEEKLLDVLGRGEILGEMALLTGERRNASIRAASAVTVGRIARSDFDQLLRDHVTLRDKIWTAFAEREFDLHMARLQAFRDLHHHDRLTWVRSSPMLEIQEPQTVDTGGAAYVFLVTGRLRKEGELVRAPALVDVRDSSQLMVADSARIIRLRPFAAVVGQA